jgi:hypothetical protein
MNRNVLTDLNAHQVAAMIAMGALLFLVAVDYGFRGLSI